MIIQEMRLELWRILAKLTVSQEIKDAFDWNQEEIQEIEYLMAEKFEESAATLFYRNGGILLGSYLLLDWLLVYKCHSI